MRVNILGGEPLFDFATHARRGPTRRDRLSAGDIALISRTVHRAPEVMVKVLPKGSTKLSSIAGHVEYLGRHRGKRHEPRCERAKPTGQA